MAARWYRALAAATLAFGLILGNGQAARALVPYTYVPRNEALEGAGLGLAQAAARLLQMGQAEDAARLAALSTQLLPNDPRSGVLLAEAQLRSKNSKEAAVALARAKQLDPKNAGIWFAEGSLALRGNHPKQAIDLLRRGLDLDRNNAGAYFDLGNAQILLGQLTQALKSFERAATLRKDFWEAVNNQSIVLYERGQTREAIQRWRQVLRLRPGAAEPTLALAAALLANNAGAASEAISLASRALDGDPNYVLPSFQQEQLWGPKLRAATARLLTRSELRTVVERAQANAGSSKDEE
ncbi:MAG: tetratricopeptide repeat protein [Cyanobacteriota bacterium]